MLLASVLLAALVPQAPAVADEGPAVSTARLQETGDLSGFEAEPATPTVPDVSPAQAMEATPVPAAEPAAAVPSAAPSAAIQADIDAGLKAFIRGRFSTAREAFQKAYDANPQSAAAAFYLGYACYKVGEPSARMNADKEKAKDLFAKAYRLDPAFTPVWGSRPASE